MNQIRWYKFFILGLVALTAVSCAKQPPRVASVEGVRNSRAMDAERVLKEASERIRTLRGMAKAVLVDNGEERRTDIVILVNRPEKIRVDAMDALADVWAAAGTDGVRLWLWLPQKNKLYRGTASARNLRKLADFDWELSEMASIISGLVPQGHGGELVEIDRKSRHFRFQYQPVHLFLDKKKAYPVRLVRYKPTAGGTDEQEQLNEVQYEVHFLNWETKGGIKFPSKIDVLFPGRNSRFTISYKSVEFNKELDPSLFKPETVWRARTVNMDR